MNDIQTIRTLTERFFDGLTTLTEEQQLYDFFSRKQQLLPPDLLPLRQMFLDLAAVQHAATVRQPRRHAWRRWAVAAAAAVLLAAGATLLFRRHATSSPIAIDADDELVACIYGRYTTDRTVVLAEVQKTMAIVSDGSADIVDEQLKAMFSN